MYGVRPEGLPDSLWLDLAAIFVLLGRNSRGFHGLLAGLDPPVKPGEDINGSQNSLRNLQGGYQFCRFRGKNLVSRDIA